MWPLIGPLIWPVTEWGQYPTFWEDLMLAVVGGGIRKLWQLLLPLPGPHSTFKLPRKLQHRANIVIPPQRLYHPSFHFIFHFLFHLIPLCQDYNPNSRPTCSTLNPKPYRTRKKASEALRRWVVRACGS